MRRIKKCIAGFLGVCLAAGMLSGCADAGKEPPGSLEKVTYRRVRGMVEGANLLLESSPENVSEERWTEIEEQVLELYPFLMHQKPNFLKNLFGKRVLDGGDVDELILVWKTEKGIEEIKYRCTNYEELEKLIHILEQ